MPPLVVVVGFGIATLNWTVFAGSLLLFVTNAITIALTAALVARVYGFGSHLSPQHTTWQLILFFAALGLLSVPLGAALRQIAFESLAQRQVRETISARFSDASRLGQLEIDYAATPIRIRAVIFTPRLDPSADSVLAADLRQLLGRPIDLHVDQLHVPANGTEMEAAQIARASNTPGTSDSERQQRAIADFALIAGVEPAAVQLDLVTRTLSAAASPLPDLSIAGYRALEQRATGALPRWKVRLAPPADAALPSVRLDAGVVSDTALNEAAWASMRLSQALLVNGGTSAQRRAIAGAINGRGGSAIAGEAGGPLRFGWSVGELDASASPSREDGTVP